MKSLHARKNDSNNTAKAPQLPAVRNLNSPGVLTEVVILRLLLLLSLVQNSFTSGRWDSQTATRKGVTIDFRQFTTPHTLLSITCVQYSLSCLTPKANITINIFFK